MTPRDKIASYLVEHGPSTSIRQLADGTGLPVCVVIEVLNAAEQAMANPHYLDRLDPRGDKTKSVATDLLAALDAAAEQNPLLHLKALVWVLALQLSEAPDLVCARLLGGLEATLRSMVASQKGAVQ